MDNCPICGKSAATADHDLADADVAWISCSDVDCPLADGLPPDVWSELARNQRLLAAVEGLEQAIKPKSALTVQYAWYEEIQPAHFLVHLKATQTNLGLLFGRPTLADALIALAEQVKE